MQSRLFKTLGCSIAGIIFGTWALSTTLSQETPGKVDFRRDVQPLFNQYCIECHGPSQQMHGFRLDRRRDAMRGVTSPVIKPGNSIASRLYLKLIGSQYGPQMPLTGALNPEQINIIKAWIDQGAEWPDDLSGDTPLPPPDPKATRIMEALRNCDRKAFEKLASQDPGVGSLKGAGGTTPLMQAVLYGDLASVRLLLANGADPNIRNEAGASALMWAVDDPEETRLLLDHGADVNARSADGRTPLLIAAGQFRNTEVVKLLLDRGADLSAKSPSGIGDSTPLSEAARIRDEKLLRMLIERGADVKSGGSGLLITAHKCEECFEMLVKRFDRDVLTRAAMTLALPGNERASKTLLDLGVDANTRDARGYTLLMLTASSDKIPTEVVKCLIDRGADLNARNPEGRTALDLAKQRGSTSVVDVLKNAGAKEGVASTETVPSPKPAGSIRAALERSLPLLQRTDATFLQKASCVSCHHNSLTAMTVAIARKNGFPVDEQIARTQLKRIGFFDDTWRERLLQGFAIGGASITSSYILNGLAAENYPSDGTTDAMARFLQSRQWPDGHWEVDAHRPPIESNDDIPVTALAVRALQVYSPKAHRNKYEASVKRATGWLIKAQPKTTQDRAFQLLALRWAGLNANNRVITKLASALLREQRPDGGWAQLSSLASDAYATGQSLVALKQAGADKTSGRSYIRGVKFLMNTQLADGSWYVKSRAIPFQPYFESGFPHGRDQWISAAATNWASMALALSSRTRR